MTFGPMIKVETSVVCSDEPPADALPSIPMIPRLLEDGRCSGRVFRNLRALLGRMPTHRELGLKWWQTVELDMAPDEMVLTAISRTWLERFRLTLLWWTKDVPWRAYNAAARALRAWRMYWGPKTREFLASPNRELAPGRVYHDIYSWPRTVTSVTGYDAFLHGPGSWGYRVRIRDRRATLSEWLRGPR